MASAMSRKRFKKKKDMLIMPGEGGRPGFEGLPAALKVKGIKKNNGKRADHLRSNIKDQIIMYVGRDK